jgi:hypothetical protein
MSEEQQARQQEEKQEKQEKQQEKEEKSWDEKWRRDPLSAAAWAIILVWAGLVLLGSNLGMFAWIPFMEAWSVFFLGAGVILLLEIGIRLALPSYRQPLIGIAVLAIVFLAVGLAGVDFVGWECVLPLAVVAVGLYLLFSALFRRRE